MSATHALKLENYRVSNMNSWISHSTFGELDNYPLEQINAFFNTLRINNCLSGYAQIIAKPIGWTETYKADLIDLKGISTKMYPVEFNNYYWNRDSFPILDEQHLKIFNICSKS